MANAFKKAKRRQAALDKNRLDYQNLCDRLERNIYKHTQMFTDCKDIKIEEPLNPSIFDKLMIQILEEIEEMKEELARYREKLKLYLETPDFIFVK